MNQQKKFQFYVIELLDSSYTKLNKYICVPHSWISLCETINGMAVAVVKFPVGILPDAKLPDGKKEFSDNRRTFMADIKYGTDKYEDAKDYIKILENISNREQRYQKILKEATPLDKEPLTSLSSLRTTNQTEENERNNYTKPNTNQTESKQMHLDNFKIGICQKQSELIERIDLTNKDKIYTVQSSKTHSSVTTGDSMVNCDKVNPKDQNNKETESSVSENQKLTNESNLFAISRPLFGENFLTILKKIYSDFEKQQMLLDTLRLAFQQQCIVLKNIIELTEKFNNFNIDDPYSAEEEIRSMEKNEMNINEDVSNKTKNKEEGKSNKDINCNDDTEIKDSEKNNLPKKIRGQARTFTLPQEYDPNNSRWTLKYRKKQKGLVELLPNSRIYIDAIKLNNCKRIARYSKTLARMLLVEIFSKTALSTCSLTGKKANAFDTDGTCIRPGLDEHARIVLLTYVEQYAIEQKWVKLETQLILGTLRNKLQEMRTKYG